MALACNGGGAGFNISSGGTQVPPPGCLPFAKQKITSLMSEDSDSSLLHILWVLRDVHRGCFMSLCNAQYPRWRHSEIRSSFSLIPQCLTNGADRNLNLQIEICKKCHIPVLSLIQWKSESQSPHQRGLNLERYWCCRFHRPQHQDQVLASGKHRSRQLRQLLGYIALKVSNHTSKPWLGTGNHWKDGEA